MQNEEHLSWPTWLAFLNWLRNFELFCEWRPFANFIGSPLDDLLVDGDLASDGNSLANSRSLPNINPVCSTIDRRDHESSFGRGNDACRGNEQEILSNTYRPINGGVHARSEAS